MYEFLDYNVCLSIYLRSNNPVKWTGTLEMYKKDSCCPVLPTQQSSQSQLTENTELEVNIILKILCLIF